MYRNLLLHIQLENKYTNRQQKTNQDHVDAEMARTPHLHKEHRQGTSNLQSMQVDSGNVITQHDTWILLAQRFARPIWKHILKKAEQKHFITSLTSTIDRANALCSR